MTTTAGLMMLDGARRRQGLKRNFASFLIKDSYHSQVVVGNIVML